MAKEATATKSALKNKSTESLFEQQIKAVDLNSSDNNNESPDDISNRSSPKDSNVEQPDPQGRKHSLDSSTSRNTNKNSETNNRKGSADSTLKLIELNSTDKKNENQPQKTSRSPSAFDDKYDHLGDESGGKEEESKGEESEFSEDESNPFSVIPSVGRRVSFSVDLEAHEDEKEAHNNLRKFLATKLKLGKGKNLPISKSSNKEEDNQDSSDNPTTHERKHSKTPYTSEIEASEVETKPNVKRQNKSIHKVSEKQVFYEQIFSVKKWSDGVGTFYSAHNPDNKETMTFYHKQFKDGSIEYKVHTAGNAEVNHD